MKAAIMISLLLVAVAAAVYLGTRKNSEQRIEGNSLEESRTKPVAVDGAREDRPLNRLVAPKIIVTKSRRQLVLYSNSQVVRTYRVGLGTSPQGDKVREGDGRTPEGEFYISIKNPRSNYYLSLGLSYPNKDHAARGLRDGLITQNEYNRILRAIDRKTMPPQNTALGGEIFIHGHGSGSDWTLGCVALDDLDIRELFKIVPLGTKVIIEP